VTKVQVFKFTKQRFQITKEISSNVFLSQRSDCIEQEQGNEEAEFLSNVYWSIKKHLRKKTSI
jgi:hypothetical protein